jgi:hypothetical protein
MANASHEEEQMIQVAYRRLNKRYRVLAPASEARVIWRDFDPCHAVQAIASVQIPAIVNMRAVTLTHTIMDGDRV